MQLYYSVFKDVTKWSQNLTAVLLCTLF